jgi:hypothetical protein
MTELEDQRTRVDSSYSGNIVSCCGDVIAMALLARMDVPQAAWGPAE